MTRLGSLSALFGVAAMLVSGSAWSDPPVGVGVEGAYQRANISSAGPGSVNTEFDPVREEPGRFSLQWIVPFFCGSSNVPAPYLTGCGVEGDLGDDIAPIYRTPDGTPDPGDVSYWTWVWPLLPQLGFGDAQGFYQAQLGVIATSLGHGTLVRNYTNSPNTTYRRPGFSFHLRTPGVVGEAIVGDLFSPASMVAARIELRPLTLLYGGDVRAQPIEFDHDEIAAPYTRWKTGLSVAADMFAPLQKTGADYRAARGPWDPRASIPEEARSLVGIGFDNAFVLVERETTEAIFYADLNGLGTPFQPLGEGRRFGVGAHLGTQLLVRAGNLQLRAELEGNVAGPGYVPGYFDQMYVVERNRLIGTDTSKLRAAAPASFGYLYRFAISYLPYVSLFVEGLDQLPADPVGCVSESATCSNNARLRAGLSGSFLMFDGTLSASQAGVQNYLVDVVEAEGLTLLAEGRMTLFFRFVQLLTRVYVVQDPARRQPLAGGFLGLEVNLSL